MPESSRRDSVDAIRLMGGALYRRIQTTCWLMAPPKVARESLVLLSPSLAPLQVCLGFGRLGPSKLAKAELPRNPVFQRESKVAEQAFQLGEQPKSTPKLSQTRGAFHQLLPVVTENTG
jgi:hypothetical protein